VLLTPRKRAPVERALAWTARRLLRGAFGRAWIGGAAPPPPAAPIIAFANHASWWDPIVAHWLGDGVLHRDVYGVMEGTGLLRYPFFRRVGMFGVTTSTPADARALAAFAGALLRGAPRRLLWIAPQGALLPARAPLVFRSGLARIARAVPEALLLPVALRYEFRAGQRPELFARLGAPVPREPGEPAPALTRRLERRLGEELATLDRDLARPGDPDGYAPALAGRGTLDALYDRTLGRRARPAAAQG
jgi:1-acyl-sn-glycerol-3-phosphate acyltransferase